MMMSELTKPPAYRTRLWIVFASEAQTAIILRRGPKNHFHLISWDLKKDSFQHGQWMKGDVRLWDLSPDGRKIMYWAQQYHASARWRGGDDEARPADPFDPAMVREKRRSPKKGEHRRKRPRYQTMTTKPSLPPVRFNEGVWTAVSNAPYFSALAIWPSFGHWTGGGTFLSNDSIWLQEPQDGMTPKQNVPIPARLRLVSMSERPVRDGENPFSGYHGWMTDKKIQDAVAQAVKGCGALWFEWAVARKNGDLLFACDGRIYRLKAWRSVVPPDILDQAKMLIDLNGLTFQKMRAPPEAMRW